jgi:hypothetical protein
MPLGTSLRARFVDRAQGDFRLQPGSAIADERNE